MELYQFIKSREGKSNKVYPDSVGKPTVGIGHLVTKSDNLVIGDTISDDKIKEFFELDIRKAKGKAEKQCSELGISDPDLLIIFVSANFQLGDFKAVFPETFELIKNKKYAQAILNLATSKWMKQTPVRAGDMISAITKLV